MSGLPELDVLLFVHEEQFKRRIASYLSSEGFHVFEPKSEEEVFRVLESGKIIHVAVVDIQIEEKKGLRCLENIKKKHGKTEVIIVNNPDRIGLSIQGMRLGAYDDIMVPFDMKKLKEKIFMAYYYGRKKQRSLKFGDPHSSTS